MCCDKSYFHLCFTVYKNEDTVYSLTWVSLAKSKCQEKNMSDFYYQSDFYSQSIDLRKTWSEVSLLWDILMKVQEEIIWVA